MADKEVAGNTFIQLNNDSFSPDSIMDMMAALSSLTDEQIAKELDLQKSLQQIRMSNAEKLNLYNKKEQEELLQAEQRAAEMLIDKQRDAKQALIRDQYQQALDEVEKLTGFEKQQRLDQINEEFEVRMENENKLAEDRKKKSEKAFKDELKRAKEQAKQKAKAEAEAGRKWATALLDPNADFDAKKGALLNIGKRTDKEGNTVRNAGTIAADIVGGLANLAKSMNNQIEEIAGKKSAIDTRLQGSKGATRGGSYWDQMSNNVLGMAGISQFVKQSDVANKIAEKCAWNIIPSGDIALNMLHLSTQVPACYEYLSNGPYREYEIYGMKLKFKHTTNKLLAGMSSKSALIIQAFKSLGEENITPEVLQTLNNILTADEKMALLDECKRVPSWIYEYIKKIGA